MEDTQILVLFLKNRRGQNEILPSPKVSHLRWLEQKDSWFQALEPQISAMFLKLLIAALRKRTHSDFTTSLHNYYLLQSHLDLLAIKIHELLFQLTLFAFPQGIGTGSRQNHPRNAKRLVIFENLSSRLCQFTQFFSDLPSGQLHALLTHVAVIQQSHNQIITSLSVKLYNCRRQG